jgi:16S rRNA (guanine966-N2)-methyltransferase
MKLATRQGRVRIIGGQWRSRIIRFPAAPNLRPSPDVVRETLFNWLQNTIKGSYCLDLFAGSGAFGFEAASRGAESVTLVESNPQIVRQLGQNCALLNTSELVTVIHSNAEQFLKQCSRKYDLVFLDPPFESGVLPGVCQLLSRGQLLSDNALVYIESPNTDIPLPIAPSWHIIRQKTRGLVQSTLIQTKAP